MLGASAHRITIGAWIEQMRCDQHLTVEDLAVRAPGLDSKTISRCEAGHGDVTLLTFVRLCDALRIDVQTVINQFIHDPVVWVQRPDDHQRLYVLTVADVNSFITLFRHNPPEGMYLLQMLMNEVQQYAKPAGIEPYTIADVTRLISEQWLVRQSITYPEALSVAQIEHIYQQPHAALLRDDATQCIATALKMIHANLSSTAHFLLNRLTQTATELWTFRMVLRLDTLTAQRGRLLKAYWIAEQIMSELAYRQQSDHVCCLLPDLNEVEHHVIHSYICLARWLYVSRMDHG